jgi:hypothetical protein
LDLKSHSGIIHCGIYWSKSGRVDKIVHFWDLADLGKQALE